MRKETFDFSEALRRMMEGKKVKRRANNECIFSICRDDCIPLNMRIGTHPFSFLISYLDTESILATDWEEV